MIVSDTDHLLGSAADAAWVWKSFTRGLNVNNYMELRDLRADTPRLEEARRATGHTRRIAERMKLAAMKPAIELASTRYCLADPGREYLVYLPDGGEVTVDLSAATGELAAEWFDPRNDKVRLAAAVVGGGKRQLNPPFDGPAVLYLSAARAD